MDFVLAQDNQMKKTHGSKKDHSINPSLCYFHEKYQASSVQVVKELKREWVENQIEVVQSINFLKSLYL